MKKFEINAFSKHIVFPIFFFSYSILDLKLFMQQVKKAILLIQSNLFYRNALREFSLVKIR